MGSLVAAYTVAWAVLMIYVWTLAKRQRQLRTRLDQLQLDQQRMDDPLHLDHADVHASSALPGAPAQ